MLQLLHQSGRGETVTGPWHRGGLGVGRDGGTEGHRYRTVGTGNSGVWEGDWGDQW